MESAQRPDGLAILSILSFGIGVMFLFLSGLSFLFPHLLLPTRSISDFLLSFAGALGGYVLLALGLGYVLAARGLWRGRNWARFLYALLVACVIIANIIWMFTSFFGYEDFLWALFELWALSMFTMGFPFVIWTGGLCTVLYLRRPSVVDFFQGNKITGPT